MPQPTRFRLNGDPVEVLTEGDRPLLDVLRDHFGLTGAKRGCEIGYCGACTVVVDGEAVPACIRMVGLVDGSEVTTVEGLQDGQRLDPVQQGFVATSGFQCGFCTPGHVMAAHALLDTPDEVSDDEVAAVVDGNYCRCTGYVKILDAVRHARDSRERSA